MRLGLVHSPFTGPGVWRALAPVLPKALVVDYGGVQGPDWYDGAAARILAQADDRPWIAVLHSGAGGFAPSLAAASTRLTGLVFVDAVLPHPGASAAEMSPAAQIERFERTARDGLLAPWNRWFPKGTVEAWVPDEAARAAVLDDLPRTPFAYLQAKVPDRSEWERLPAAFVKLSEGFERNATRAEARGWPVHRLDLNHLGMASDPQAVAAAVLVSVETMGA